MDIKAALVNILQKIKFATFSNGSPVDGEQWYDGGFKFRESGTTKTLTAGGVVSGSVDNAALRADGTGGATSQGSAIVISDYTTSTQNNAGITADDGSTANIGLYLSPKGTGALTAHKPDGTATGGNARGTYSVDFQVVRGNASEVASGVNSAILGGQSNTAASAYSVVAGGSNNNIGGGGTVATQFSGVLVKILLIVVIRVSQAADILLYRVVRVLWRSAGIRVTKKHCKQVILLFLRM